MTEPLIGSGGVLHHRRICEEAMKSHGISSPITGAELSRLRQDLSPELAAFVVTLQSLQSKAAKKLGPLASELRIWWATDRALQQASPWQAAAVKAKWFGNKPTLDLCCGIGGDAMFLASRGPVVAVDSDPLITELAAMNLNVDTIDVRLPKSDSFEQSSSPPARVVCNDVTELAIDSEWLVHLDPDRRPGSKRASRPDQYQPGWSFVSQLLRSQSGVAVKLAPAAEPELTDCPPTHRCWISVAGSVREQSLLSGEAMSFSGLAPQLRSAIVARSDGGFQIFAPQIPSDNGVIDSVGTPLEWLVDPDAAIRAAGLSVSFGFTHGLRPLGRPSGFFTADDPPDVGHLAQVAKVIWAGSCDDRKLRREMRSRNVYPDVIKVRGTDHQPEVLRKKYRKCGDTPVQLWIGRGPDRVYAALAERSPDFSPQVASASRGH